MAKSRKYVRTKMQSVQQFSADKSSDKREGSRILGIRIIRSARNDEW